MINVREENSPIYTLIHPLDDIAEIKHNGEGLGRMQMTRTVRLSLLTLRLYLIFVMALAFYHVLVLARVFR